MIAKSFDEAFSQVQGLVEDFRRNEAFYLSSKYTEPRVREDFINKFWMALGWDVRHDEQKNPYEQEVIVEKSVEVNGRGKRADYAFLVAPNFRDVRFFVEAKKPSRNIDTADDYFQTVRYGWNAHTPIAVLMDFEQLRVLDCRYEPNIDSVLSYAGLEKFYYLEYADPERFRRIYHLFSRQDVATGSLERYAEDLPKPGARAGQRSLFVTGRFKSVDESFLENLDSFRAQLAHTFKSNNPQLGSSELTEITQRTLDRLVFMRFLEDKLIETVELVQKIVDSPRPWHEFVTTSRRLNEIYNGIIFRSHDILDAAGFKVDERVFADICESLSHAQSPYLFNYIPIHILGSIYERFLGKTIVVEGADAGVHEKPEVRKAGGVYYTPEYIVRYIVENTVGRAIEGNTPEKISRMSFADISCGSGSFLLGVYDLLLRYYRTYYNAGKRRKAEGRKAGCVELPDETLQLSLKQKREILKNNIYGVDIDAQAVEVAQLSLYLKLLEDETTGSARLYQIELGDKLLPSLSKNIISGNSLIERDILSGKLFDKHEEQKLNPMNFEEEFPSIMKGDGFDVIVGNPPYVFGRDWKALQIPAYVKDYFREKYKSSSYQLDMFSIFMERALQLCKAYGYVGQIVPNVWLTNTYSSVTRAFVLRNTQGLCITVPFPTVFQGLTVDTIIYTCQKSPSHGDLFSVEVLQHGQLFTTIEFNTEDYLDGQRPISTALAPEGAELLSKLQKLPLKLKDVANITRGVHPYRLGGYGQTAFGIGPQTQRDIDERPYHSSTMKPNYREFIYGKDLKRFLPPIASDYIKYGAWLAEPRRQDFFEGERVYSRKILGDRLVVTLERTNSVADQQVYITKPKKDFPSAPFIAGVLGSKLIAYFIRSFYDEVNDAFPQIKVGQLQSLPFPSLDIATDTDRALHERMVQLVEQMLEANKQLNEAIMDRDKNYYERKRDSLERQIDELVYELYGLMKEEISLVEREQVKRDD